MIADPAYQQAAASGTLSPEALQNLKRWLTESAFAAFVPDLHTLIDQKAWEQLEDSFYSRIMVGTGGIRGPLRVGPNGINCRTIGEAAQGLSHFIHDFGEEAVMGGVVVGYEARKQSADFARLCCEVFAANGIKAFLFDGLRTTPEVSFAVRHLKTTAGVMITASHNPRTDNGFKFYWSDGGQVVPPQDLKFMGLVNTVQDIKRKDFSEAEREGLVTMIGKEVDDAYLAAIRGLSLVKSRSAKIVYSPIHGAGSTNVLPVLTAEGFAVEVVEEQRKPDENFPTAHGDLINPEYDGVIARAVKQGESSGADVIIVSDPDADRIGVASKVKLGAPTTQHLNGNEVGVALTHFILSERKAARRLPPSSIVITTNVTTTLISDIARSFGIRVVNDLLVGYKFIAEVIEKLPQKSDFVFAAEESLGYLAGTFVRDKDAAIASLLLGELVSKLKDEGKTLIQHLDTIYEHYGYYRTILRYIEMKGKEGFLRKERMMLGLRSDPPKAIGGFPVLRVIDRLPEEKRQPGSYKVGMTGDQLTFILSEDERRRVAVRPSGTEPMIKCYIQHFEPAGKNLSDVRMRIDQEAAAMVESIVQTNSQRADRS